MSGKDNNSFWVSYSDLATGLMIVFMLVMLIMVILQKQAGEIQTDRISELTAKVEIILGQKNSLSKAIEMTFQKSPKVKADPVTAQISIDENILKFKEGKATLSQSGKAFLRDFTPKYICALWEYEFQQCVDKYGSCSRLDPERPSGVRRIHVTGHADLLGEYKQNHYLSSLRAEEVVTTMLTTLERSPPSDLSPLCAKNMAQLSGYAEERLWAVGAGETQHCSYELNRNSDTPQTTKGKNATLKKCSNTYEKNSKYRKVDFSLELTGDDMTGLLADVVALRSAVGGPASKESEEIDELADNVAEACWKNPRKYHGCEIFARDCLAGRDTENCQKMFEAKERDLGVLNMVLRVCRRETLPKCP